MINQKSNIKWTSYDAITVAEEFTEKEGISKEDAVEAWAFIIATKLYNGLEGWFGRTCRDLINFEIISEDGQINWDLVEDL